MPLSSPVVPRMLVPILTVVRIPIHMGRSLLATIVAGCVTSTALAANIAAPETWELRDGRWQKVSAVETAVAPRAADPTLDAIERMITSHHYSGARKRLVAWFKSNAGHKEYDRALYLMAEALYGYGDRLRAFYYCDQLMDEHPESDYFYKALEKQYQIADAYLDGYKRRILGVPLLWADSEAIEMLFRIQQRSPGSPLAERALLRSADYYYKNKDYDIAGDVYAAYIKSYSRSPNIPQVRLRRAYANLAQFRGERFDPTPILDARQQMVEIVQDYPDLAKEEGLEELIVRVDDTIARKMAYTGDFYRRTHLPKSSAYVYRDLLNRYPDSPSAAKATKAIPNLPEPDVMPPGTPSTQPLSRAD